MTLKRYVLGFAFDSQGQFVALIRKNRPEWMAGKLNGIGGQVEPTDSSLVSAQRREFREEAGLDIPEDQWEHAGEFSGPGWQVAVFKTFTPDLRQVRSMTDEEVEIRSAGMIRDYGDVMPGKVMHNVPTLLSLCLRKDLAHFHLTEK